ncbi:MAG TPA: VWA domain-containing protein [Thermoanaerobaculia bacterium]|nr:VWA domain-containing protein [Thermoanaerobaculia bacterium]
MAAAVAALLLAWIGATVPVRRAPLLALAVDVSASVEPAGLEQALERVTALSQRSARSSLLAFADRTTTVRDSSALRETPLLVAPRNETPPGALWRGRSDLQAALDLAAAELHRTDPQRLRPWRVVLWSDGVETAGSVDRLLPRLSREGASVDVIPLETHRAALELGPLRLPRNARAGDPLQAEIALWSDRAVELEVVLVANETEIARQRHAIDVGVNELVIPVRIPFAGAVTLRAAADTGGETLGQAVSPPLGMVVGEPLRVLLVAEPPAPSRLLASLETLGWTTGRAAPDTLSVAALSRVDAVVLDDVAADRLGPQAQRAVRDFVLDGGGLLFLAGPSTFGEEGYSGGDLEQVLPMRFNVEEERTDVALMIALDKSYSMKGDKMELAKEAAKAVVGELDDEHRFGLVAFDWNPYRVVQLQLARNREQILDDIRRIEASAQTNFYPALESCFQQLAEVEAKVKHVILISDGRTYPDEYRRLVEAMRDAKITVSTVGVGAEADEALLADIARWGDGAAYLVSDASRVQQILLDETRSKTEDTLVEQSTPIRLAMQASALEGIELASAPPLLGHVTLEAREDVEVVLATEDEKPLLARWNVGLGRTWMFAADLGGTYTSSWRSWPDGPRLVSQLLRDAAARGVEEPVALDVTRASGGFVASLSVSDREGAPSHGLGASVEALRADDTLVTTVRLDQVAPGRYEAFLDDDELVHEGEDLVLRARIGGVTVATRPLRPPGARELRPGPPDTALLERIAYATGGRFDPTNTEILEHSEGSRASLWPPLAVLALTLYLLEVLVRRTGWPRQERSVTSRETYSDGSANATT